MTRSLVALSIATLFLSGPAMAEEERYPCQNTKSDGTITLADLKACLEEHKSKLPDDAVVSVALMEGLRVAGDETTRFSFSFPAPAPAVNAAVAAGAYCTEANTLLKVRSVGYVYIWCKKTTGVAHRDAWWEASGAWISAASKDYRCSVAAELAAMPYVVKAAVCP